MYGAGFTRKAELGPYERRSASDDIKIRRENLEHNGEDLPMATDDAKAALRELAPIDGIIQSVRQALSSPATFMNNTTWRGAAADAWRSDWEARRKEIETFLDDAQAEANRLRRSLQSK